MYIPDGYGTMFPYIFAKEASEFVAFLEDAFDAVEVGRTVAADGSIANARVRIGTTTFMVSEASDQFKPTQSAFYLYVEDADRTFQTALSRGAEKILEPMDMDYGDRQGGVTDPAGNIWWISTRLVQEPYDE